MGLPIIPEMMYISVNVKLESTFFIVELVKCKWSLRYIIGVVAPDASRIRRVVRHSPSLSSLFVALSHPKGVFQQGGAY